MTTTNSKVESIYYDPSRAASFGGIHSLARECGVSERNVRNWLTSQDAYTLHKQPRRNFRRRKTLSTGIDDLWQADLVDLTSLSAHNGGHKFVLTVIDVFSKFAWARPLKNKSGAALTEAFASIVRSRKPNFLQTDKGTEFLNATFQRLLAENDIRFYTSQNEDIKCAVVERFNRTLKSRMFRYFTYKSTSRYLDVLQQFIDAYNRSYHRTIKTTPSSVNANNENEIHKLVYASEKKKLPPKWRFDAGDKVRLCQARRPFRKGYLPGWTTEIFTVKSRISTDPPTYEIVDYDGESVLGKFYAEELQRVSKTADDFYDVERVIKTRKRGGVVEHFVKWVGYPDKFNSWTSGIIVRDGQSDAQSDE